LVDLLKKRIEGRRGVDLVFRSPEGAAWDSGNEVFYVDHDRIYEVNRSYVIEAG